MSRVLFVALIAVVACNHTEPTSTVSERSGLGNDKHDTRHGDVGSAGKASGADEGMHEMAMPPVLAKFHDTLAPRWHAEHGPQRMTDTCAAIGQFTAGAADVQAAAPPDGADAATWTDGGKQLASAVAALEQTCKANDAAAFEPAFAAVHQGFHGLLAALGGQDKGHGEHAMDHGNSDGSDK